MGQDNQKKRSSDERGRDRTRRIRGLSDRLRESALRETEGDTGFEESPPEEESRIRQKTSASGRQAEAEPESSEDTDDVRTRKVRQLQNRRSVTAMQDDTKSSSRVSDGTLLKKDQLLQERYRILGVIGIGGMGAVYKAQDLRFANVERICAVKEMINTATDPDVRQMIVRNFEREASILATLNHPAIPQVYDYFTEGKRSYLVLEYISGKDLEALLGEVEGFLREERVVEWAIQLCDVLSYLHRHEPHPVIFRDLKPSNIMLDAHQRIRLVDFGIAKIFQSGIKGTMIGTEGYSPPEQYRGTSEPRGDVYALGATLHHLLSKQDPRLEPPFSFHERPIHQSNPTVSKDLVDVLRKALEYDINERWGSAEEMKRALLALPVARGLGRNSTGDTAAFADAAVKPLWRFACEDEVRADVAVTDERVFVPSYDHNVYALNRENGDFVWKYAAEGGVGTRPLVVDDVVVFGSTDTVVYAVDSRAGRLLWTASLEGKIYSSPYADLGHVFVGSDDRHLYAIQLISGRKAWSYEGEGAIRSRPMLADNMIFFACDAGVVYALGLDRKIKWRFRARRGMLSSPVLHEGLIFIGSLDWNFYGLDARSGWAAWRYRTGGPIVSTPAVTEDLVIFGSADGYIYALDASEGRLVWRHDVEAQVTGSPVIYQDRVYIGSVDGVLYCLEARSGNLNWTYQSDGAITARPTVKDDVVYVGSLDHYVYAIPA
jgi:outer membrane protein assembly factor BamB/tRNA A-37 threonylcarbamoyl transferase component Bud32